MRSGAGGSSRALNLFCNNIPPLDEPVKGGREDNVTNDDEGEYNLFWEMKMKPSLPPGERMVTLPYMGCALYC